MKPLEQRARYPHILSQRSMERAVDSDICRVALDLEDIKEVGPRRMDLNEISIRCRSRGRKSSDFQIKGRLLKLVQRGQRVNT
jgi:hypothetical protein